MMTTDEKLDILTDAVLQMSKDINIIKCLLITNHAQKRFMDPKKLANDLNDIYDCEGKIWNG